MLVKASQSSARVKAVALHPTLSWVAIALHSGAVHIWDFRFNTIVSRFIHCTTGACRSVDFHPTQPLFVSGGDDHSIKVFNYKTKQIVYEVRSHLDFVRSVRFHHEQPWILSAADDQMMGIHNWQNRESVATVTGHNHYVMSARWHPTEPLIVSASMDSTVRVWNYEKLLARCMGSIGGSGSRPKFALPDDVACEFVISTHDRGVNCADFHPTLPLIVSGGDDRAVKVHRFKEQMWWPMGDCRGHFGNVESVSFFPAKNQIVSASDDRSIRIWCSETYRLIETHRRDADRYWCAGVHPTCQLVAVGHDSGTNILKLGHERRPVDVPTAPDDSRVFSLDGEFLNVRDAGAIQMLCKVLPLPSAEPGGAPLPVRRLYMNNLNVKGLNFILDSGLPSDSSGSAFSLITDGGSGFAMNFQTYPGVADGAAFVSRNRVAVYDKANSTVNVFDCDSYKSMKSIPIPSQFTRMYFGGQNRALFRKDTTRLSMFDLTARRIIGEADLPKVPNFEVKSIVWNNKQDKFAMLSKHALCIYSVSDGLRSGDIADATLKLETCHSTDHSTIKSAAFTETDVLIFSSHSHVQYLTIWGDHGVTQSFPGVIYIHQVKNGMLKYTDRTLEGQMHQSPLSTTEFSFKQALHNSDFAKVAGKSSVSGNYYCSDLVQNGALCGASVVAHLQSIDKAEVALSFTTDPLTRFNLALNCGAIEEAAGAAKILESNQLWNRLAETAIKFARFSDAEHAYRANRNYAGMLALYSLTGNLEKIRMLQDICIKRKEMNIAFQCALLCGDEAGVSNLLTGLDGQKTWDTALEAVMTPMDKNAFEVHPVSAEKYKTAFDEVAAKPRREVHQLDQDEFGSLDEEFDGHFDTVDEFADILPGQLDEVISAAIPSVTSDWLVLEGPSLERKVADNPDSWLLDLLAVGDFEAVKQRLDRDLGVKSYRHMHDLIERVVLGAKLSVPKFLGGGMLLRTAHGFADPRPDRTALESGVLGNARLVNFQEQFQQRNFCTVVAEVRTVLAEAVFQPLHQRDTELLSGARNLLRVAWILESLGETATEQCQNAALAYLDAVKCLPRQVAAVLKLAVQTAMSTGNFVTCSEVVRHFLRTLEESGRAAPPQLQNVLSKATAKNTNVNLFIKFPSQEKVCIASRDAAPMDRSTIHCNICESRSSSLSDTGKICPVCEIGALGSRAAEKFV